MENLEKEIPQITPESIEEQFEHKETPKNTKNNSNFDVKHYLNVRLGDNDTEKKLQVRLLPINGSKIAAEVYTHNVKIPKNLVKDNSKGWKSYICLKRTEGLDSKYGNKCPFCDTSYEANKLRRECDDQLTKLEQEGKKNTDEYMFKLAEREKYFKVMQANIARKTYISRVIDRDHEEDGVKFWKYYDNSKGEGVYDQLKTLYNQRKEEGAKVKRTINIFDNENGRDITVTFTKPDNELTPPSPPKILDVGFDCPISDDKEQQQNWLNDPKKWWEVFPAKPYEYLSLVMQGKEPWYDKANDIWVDREMFHGDHRAKEQRPAVNDNELSDFGANRTAQPTTPTPDSGILDSVTVPDELPF